MKTAELIQSNLEGEQFPRTGTARRSPQSVEQQLSGCTLTELMERSETVTEVLKRILQFSVPVPKNTH
jgi:hypothetical protein